MSIIGLIQQSLADKAENARELAMIQREPAMVQANQAKDLALINREPAMINAATNKLTGTADARLTNVRADLLPAESRSQIDLNAANAFLARENGGVVRSLAASEIDARGASADATRFDTASKQYLASEPGVRDGSFPGLLAANRRRKAALRFTSAPSLSPAPLSGTSFSDTPAKTSVWGRDLPSGTGFADTPAKLSIWGR
jgi:hypothetical protein